MWSLKVKIGENKGFDFGVDTEDTQRATLCAIAQAKDVRIEFTPQIWADTVQGVFTDKETKAQLGSFHMVEQIRR